MQKTVWRVISSPTLFQRSRFLGRVSVKVLSRIFSPVSGKHESVSLPSYVHRLTFGSFFFPAPFVNSHTSMPAVAKDNENLAVRTASTNMCSAALLTRSWHMWRAGCAVRR